jgi:predicted neutral ceramidase superfamily lipid hydrolase
MKTYKIAVSWTETGIVLIRGNNIESAIKKAERTIDDIPLPEGEYLDESFQINRETTKMILDIQNKKGERWKK